MKFMYNIYKVLVHSVGHISCRLDVFHKYDGFVYPKPGRLGRLVSSGSPMHDRRQFFKIFFPKWSGFCVGPFDKNIKPDEALKKLGRLVEGISTLWTSTSGYFRCNDVDKHKLSIEKVRTCRQHNISFFF